MAIFTEVSGDTALSDPLFPAPGRNLGSKSSADLWDAGAGIKWPFEWGSLGLTYDYRSSDVDTNTIPGTDGFLSQNGDLERHSVGLTGAYKVNDQVAIGYRYTYIDLTDTLNFKLNSYSTPLAFNMNEDFTGHKNQAGVQYLLNDLIAFGLDGYYGIGDLSSNFAGDGDSDSYSVRAGTAFSINKDIPLLFALDVNYESIDTKYSSSKNDDDIWGIHLGAEYEVYKDLFLRAGYQYEDYRYKETAFSASTKISPNISTYSVGLGYNYEKISLDYGFMYSDTGDGDMMHVVSLGFNF